MRQTLIFIATFLGVLSSFGQTLKRQANETVDTFAIRYKPDSTELAHTVLETNSIDTAKKIIIAFYKKTIYEVRQMKTYVDHSQYNILIGYSFFPLSDNEYQKKLIDTIYPDGGDPEIIAIFFANADKDKGRELVILRKVEQQHYDMSGAFYETCIYDFTKGDFIYMKKLSETFQGCECGWRDGKTEKANYKTAKDIRTRLTKMGYRQ